MNICLIGDGLISLMLAKALINNDINVFLYSKHNKKILNNNRTIGITADNLDFIKKEIIKIKKSLYWEIDEIEIYNFHNKDKTLLNFSEKKKNLFSIFKNKNLYDLLNKDLEKNKNFKKNTINNNLFYKNIINNKKYELIINCEKNNQICNKYFYRKILKNYRSTAYVTIINHNKIKNKKAIQIFTKQGPLAFLPLSENQTSIVYSIKNKSINNMRLSQKELEKFIFINNKKYEINKINKFENFSLNSKILRKYYHNNILAFGDLLHQIHPLSGQGFNMTLRDIKIFIKILKEKKNLGLPIDNLIYKEFENKTKHLNFVFSFTNDFIYEFFNYDNFIKIPFSSNFFSYLKNNSFFNKLAIKYANKGLLI